MPLSQINLSKTYCFILFSCCFFFVCAFCFQFITVPVRPMVEFTSKVFVGHKQTTLLIREVEGNPTPIISWNLCHRKNVCDKQYLNISKVQTAHANYDCTARNALGVDSATTVLCKWTLLCTCRFVARKFAP